MSPLLTVEEFVRRASSLNGYKDLDSLRADAVRTENLYRELFSRRRESWEVPEIDDPHLFLIDVFECRGIFRRLPRFEDDTSPRCFDLGDGRGAEGTDAAVPDKSEFVLSWDCLTEGLLRFLNWDNVIAAGGAVAGCLAPLPEDVTSGGPSATRVRRRRYFHDAFLPGSDIDLFLYGLNESEAEDKLLEIYDAVQAANPYEIRAFRSAHAVTLVSQYPFRHVQIVLRLYNSPSEVLMGFDVDACAAGYDGRKVLVCPRTALAMMTQSNTVDMSRRSPSYEMRLAKYAQRGYEVVVPTLDRDRIDPFLYEKRFDQTKGLARLLLLERLRTPEERLRYRIEGQLKRGAAGRGNVEWLIRNRMQKAMRDIRNVERAEGVEGIAPPPTGAEASNYSTVFLPWGPGWSAGRIERLTKKKDKILNKIEFLPDGRVVKCRRPYKIHVCAVGTMAEVLGDPFPDDPPVPDDVSSEALDSCVRGKLSWLVDNPGRQQIGSFHPINDGDWMDGAYISHATEALIAAAVAGDGDGIVKLLDECKSEEEASELLAARDFLGRSALHVAALARSTPACGALLQHSAADAEFLKGRLADGRTALHLAAMRGDSEVIRLLLEKRRSLAQAAAQKGDDEQALAAEILDVDASDWEVKMNALQYAVALGHTHVVQILLSYGAGARKIAVNKDRNESLSVLALLALYASECGQSGSSAIKPILELLLDAGASTAQVDTFGLTCWHRLAASTSPQSCSALETFLEVDASRNNGKARALDLLDSRLRTPLFVATACGNSRAVRALLGAGATPCFAEDDWDARVRQVGESAAAVGGGRVLVRCRVGYGGSAGDGHGDNFRCPVSLAAENADGPCLEAYISHDPSLANATIQVPKTGQHQRGARRGESQTTPARPLDLLEKARLAVLGIDNPDMEKNWSRNVARTEATIRSLRARIDEMKRERDVHREKSYQAFVWALIVCREEQVLAATEHEAKHFKLLEQEERDEKDAIKQIEEACRIIREAGGKTHPREEEGEKTDESERQMTRSEFPSEFPRADDSLPDPFQAYSEMQPLDFDMAHNMSTGYIHHSSRRPLGLSRFDQKSAFDLMVAASTSDAEAIRTMSALVRICIVDSTGNTPLFLAVLTGSTGSLKAIFDAAMRQFELYTKKQKSRKQEQEQDKSDEKDDAKNLKDQLRRLNNLDIAAGEIPRDAGPTPHQMRQRLEAAEAAALMQLEAGSAVAGGGKTGEEPPSSPVSPEALLLHRSIVLPNSESRVMELKSRLASEQPGSCPEEWVRQPVRLRPIELAVVRADVEMVKALVELATVAGSAQDAVGYSVGDEERGSQPDGRDKQSSLSDSDEEEEEEYYDDDGEYCDDDGADNHRRGDGTAPLAASQLRYLLAGEGSRNPDLGGMTLLQLAVAVDDVEIFCVIASYTQEYGLPRGAVASWKRDVDMLDDSAVDEKTKESRRKETSVISGDSPGRYYYSSGSLPLWITDNGSSYGHGPDWIFAHTTPLQFALSVGSRSVALALMTGEADDVLLGWTFKYSERTGTPAVDRRSTKKVTRRGDRGNAEGMEGAVAAAGWISRQITESGATMPELALRLVRPTAPDDAGRTALFYAPAVLTAAVVDSAVKATVLAAADEPSVSGVRSPFLESLTARGSVTALMAAASAGEAARVSALVKAGCNRSKARGPKRWGPVHLAIPSKANSDQQSCSEILYDHQGGEAAAMVACNSGSQRWERAREIIELILDGASEYELDEALLSPEAEHTPLMLAAARGADGAMISFLVEKTVARAVGGLARRDSELNSALHLAVGAALNVGGNRDGVLGGVTALLERSGSSVVLGPNVENAQGVTPSELALQSVTMVWDRSSMGRQGPVRRTRTDFQQRKRERMGKGPLPPKSLSPEAEKGNFEGASEPSVTRRALILLDLSPGDSPQGRRLPVSLDEVQEAKKKPADRAKDSTGVKQRMGRGQDGEDHQSEPCGPPAVLAVNHMCRRMGGAPVQWNGWPPQ